MPESVPSFSSVTVSDVTVVDVERHDVDPQTAADVRKDLAEILAKAGRERGGAPGPANARARIMISSAVDLSDAGRVDGFGAFIVVPYLPFILLGANTTWMTLSVELTLESAGRTFAGHGEAEKAGSFYAPARRRALAVALERALADAASKGCPATGEDRRRN